MEIITLLVTTTVIFLEYTANRRKYSFLLLLTSTIWVITLLYSFRIVDIGEVSFEAWCVLILGIVSISLGSVFSSNIPVHIVVGHVGKQNSRTLNRKVLWISAVTIMAFMVFTATKTISLMMSGYALLFLRGNFVEYITNTDFLNYFHQFVATPFIGCFTTIAIAQFMRSHQKGLMVIALVLVALYSITDGSRYFLYTVLIQAIICYLIYTDKVSGTVFGHKMGRKMKTAIILLFILIIMGVVYISQIRDSKYGFFETIYVYFAGCLPHLSYRLPIINSDGVMTFGLASIRGFLEPIRTLLHFVGLDGIFNGLYSDMNAYWYSVEEFVNLGTIRFNAFVTPFYTFYLDGGYIGVALFSFIYGFIGKRLEIMAEKERDLYTVSRYLIFMQTVILFMMRWEFASYRYALSYIWLWVVFSKQSRRKNIDESAFNKA